MATTGQGWPAGLPNDVFRMTREQLQQRVKLLTAKEQLSIMSRYDRAWQDMRALQDDLEHCLLTATPQPAPNIVTAAVGQAQNAMCLSQRGAVVFGERGIYGVGFNRLPRRPSGVVAQRCSEECKRDCRMRTVHAEEVALQQAALNTDGADLLHVKVKGGRPVASGPPSCIQCAARALDAGIRGVWLLHEVEGSITLRWHRYDAEEFYRLSLQHGRAELLATVAARRLCDELVAKSKHTHGSSPRHHVHCADCDRVDEIKRLLGVSSSDLKGGA